MKFISNTLHLNQIKININQMQLDNVSHISLYIAIATRASYIQILHTYRKVVCHLFDLKDVIELYVLLN